MRDHLILFVNGQRHEIRGAEAWSTLSDFLRRRLRLTGTKVVCAEGDCGACSVLLARTPGRDLGTLDPLSGQCSGDCNSAEYVAVDSCILFLFQLDLCHVITVEGLGEPTHLHPVQSAMVDHYGSQCGFCTPGFVTTLAGLTEDARARGERQLSPETIERGLTGNLCRCTGYLQIVEAAQAIDLDRVPGLEELYPAQSWLADGERSRHDAISISDAPRFSEGNNGSTLGHSFGLDSGPSSTESRRLLIPTSLDDAVDFLAQHPGARIVAGATDLGVQINKGRIELGDVLHMADRLPELAAIEIEENVLVAGAASTWTQIQGAIERTAPELAKILEVFGAPQIRNVATLGGNLINASPIADSLPFLFVCGASLEVRGPCGGRRIAIEDFYLGYKKPDLAADELLVRVLIPLPTRDETLRLYKMSKRRDLDISSFTAAVLIRRSGQTVTRARVALGGVGPVVTRLPAVEQALEGKPFDLESARKAGLVASRAIAPISDVRGHESYRRQLAENLFLRFYYDVEAAPLPAEV